MILLCPKISFFPLLSFVRTILRILVLALSVDFSCSQVTRWNVRTPVIFQDLDFIEPGSPQLLDEPLLEPKFLSDYSSSSIPYKPHTGSSFPYESHECPVRYEFLDSENIEHTRELTRECSGESVSCYHAHFSKYRTIDGSCNNLQNPNWGKSNICLRRILPYDYADGKSYPRGSCTKNPLPNARWISNVFHKEKKIKESPETTQFLEWGQVLAHDLSLNDVFKTPGYLKSLVYQDNVATLADLKATITRHILSILPGTLRRTVEHDILRFHKVAGNGGQRMERTLLRLTAESGFNIPMNCCISGPVVDDKCISVPIPKDDFLNAKLGTTCMNFIRTVPCPCNAAIRQHWNQNTAYHDLSLVYASNEKDARNLRSGVHGMLKIQYSPKAGPLLPPVPIEELCIAQNYSANCFEAGDTRSNQNIFIMTMHTEFVRYHNFLCQELSKINPHWDDEKLYQEARRIFIAQAQMITFGQYLPLVLGEFMDKEGLNVLPGAKYTEYDPTLDASIADEYTTVAARYGHSHIPDLFSEISTKTGSKTKQFFADYYYRPFRFYDGQFDKVAKGMTVDKKRKHDVFLASSVRDFTYRRVYLNEVAGLDLAALSLVRGRDHGIPGYTYYLKHLFNISVNSFQDLRMILPPKTVDLLKQIYHSVHDVEIYAAGLAEYYVKRGLVGPTFASILAQQYRRTKYGDRFWFEHGNQAGSFTPDQLIEIKKTSLARILCETTNMKSIQEFVFLPPSPSNPVVPCEKIPRFNLYLWKD